MNVIEELKNTIASAYYDALEHHESREMKKEEWQEYRRQVVLENVKNALLYGGIQDTISDWTTDADKDMGLQEIILEQFKAVFKTMK